MQPLVLGLLLKISSESNVCDPRFQLITTEIAAQNSDNFSFITRFGF